MARDGIGLFQHKNKPRNKRYWCFADKDVQGVWREKSTGKLDKKEAWDEKQEFLEKLEAGSLPTDMAKWTLKAAIEDYNSYRQVTASRKTAQCERGYLRTVLKVWDENRVLNTLQPLDLERYQVTRRATVQPRTVKMIMIGKSSMASIRLKGLFAPKSAALISKRENKYFIAPEPRVKLRINGEEVYSQRELAPGDVIEIGKMKAAFSFQD